MKYIFLFFLLVAVIISAGCMQSVPTKSKITPAPTSTECQYSTCNGVCYYNGSQTCCGGHLYNIDDGECCAGIIHDYDKDQGTCCGGKWIVSGTAGECCPNPEILTVIPSWQNYEQVWINTSIQHCCAGKVAAGGKETGMKPPSYYPTGVWADCGNNTCYDTSSQSCCAPYDNPDLGFRIIRPGVNSCCEYVPSSAIGGDVCDPDTGIIHPKRTGSSCKSGTGPGSCYEENKQYFPPYVKI